MATNIYGVCRGSSSTKYDLWANVTEDSVSTLDNTSRITVKIYLKRNDGTSSSAYNLYESSNSVALKINGVKRVDKNLAIDTRNGVTVLLASYAETVSHNSDGSLNLKIDAEFSMGNTSLSGGSISGNFKGATIPRASEMIISRTTINPGDTVEFTVSAPSSSFSHKVTWSLGDKSDTLTLPVGVLASAFTVPKDWAGALIASSSSVISVSLATYNGTIPLGTRSYEIKFLIPATEEYKPKFEISVARDNGEHGAEFDEYIKGVSTLTIEPAGLEFSYGASLAAVTITLGEVSIRRIPAVFSLVSAGEQTITVAVRDTRGMLTVKTQTITVSDYEKPSVEIASVERCNSVGESDPVGTCAIVRYRVGFSSLDGQNKPNVYLVYRKTNEEAYTSVDSVEGSPFIFGNGGIAVGSSYEVTLYVGDSLSAEEGYAKAYISSGDVPFNIRRGGKGASFGKFSEEDMLLDVGWSMRVSGDMEISGTLNSENVECECTELTSSMVSRILYYPCLNLVLLRIRVDALNDLSADTVHHVATVKGPLPGVFSPLTATATYGTGSHSSAGITYDSGSIVLWSDKVVPQNSRIYISGFYMVEKGGD